MAPSIDAISQPERSQSFAESPRPAKRLKLHGSTPVSHQRPAQDKSAVVKSHPLGVKPSGNAFTASINLKNASGYFALLPDELLLHVLEYFHAPGLVSTGATCKALYAYARSEELWRSLFVESPPKDFKWQGSWRGTYLRIPKSKTSTVNCNGLFTDALHRPFYCANVPLDHYAEDIPPENEITRLPDLTAKEFATKWVDKPFILTSPVKEWPIYRDWNPERLLAEHRTTSFRAEAVDWPLDAYVSYMEDTSEESPLYLFDHAFAEKLNLTIGDPSPASTSSYTPSSGPAYTPPSTFQPDLFTALGPHRPHHRWLIMGPARSGSTFHQDPNRTSAWNAVLSGTKYWLMTPPSIPPPGIILSPDRAEITAPLSIPEYLLGFHAACRAAPGTREGLCRAGEVLHVPAGWFHLVLNLEPGAALTQNFVPPVGLALALTFLRDRPEQASGFADGVEDPHGLFVEALRRGFPVELERAEKELEEKGRGGRRRWEEIKGRRGGVGEVDGEGGSQGGRFSFGFGGDDDDADVP